jgi:hypothetical protein
MASFEYFNWIENLKIKEYKCRKYSIEGRDGIDFTGVDYVLCIDTLDTDQLFP